MTTLLQFPLNHAAERKADDAFYARHPEMVVGGQRRKLTADAPDEAPLREEWRQLYVRSGGIARQPPPPGPSAAAAHDRMRDSLDKGFSRDRSITGTVQECAGVPANATLLPAQYDRPCNLAELVVTESRGGVRSVRCIVDPPSPQAGAMVLSQGGIFAMVAGTPAASMKTRVSFQVKGDGFCGVAPHPMIEIDGFPPDGPGKQSREITVHGPAVEPAREGASQLLATTWAMMHSHKTHGFTVRSCGLPAGDRRSVPMISGQLAVYHDDAFELTLKSNSWKDGDFDTRAKKPPRAKSKKKEEDDDSYELKLTHKRDGRITTTDFANYIGMVKKIEKRINELNEIVRKTKWVPGPRLQGSIAVLNGNLEVGWQYEEPPGKPHVELVVKGEVSLTILEGDLTFSFIITPYPCTKVEVGIKVEGSIGFTGEFEWRAPRPLATNTDRPDVSLKPQGKVEASTFVNGQVGFVKAVLEGRAEVKADLDMKIGGEKHPIRLKAENGRLEKVTVAGSIDFWICEKGFEEEIWDRLNLFDSLSFPSGS
ncbi:hypothetical protein [Niveispirillum sp. KHB5.9]|uniref:hypothetical protein n=1 Tax=Niveispirillum sp. KHB5.9 TaxID=3400269 RepID=UPI003A8915B6